jgi:polyribonucleotide nucleotidyltransferase
MHILGEMAKAMTDARSDVKEYAPRITIINIPKDKIREVIGTGGKVIREICRDHRRQDRHRRRRHHQDRRRPTARRARSRHRLDPLHRRRAGSGRDLQGKVVKVRGFRRLRELPRQSRRPRPHLRTGAAAGRTKVADVVNVGDEVWVKVLGVDERGKVKPVDEGRRPGNRQGNREGRR